MKTNHYESVVILNATLEDSQIESILSSLQEQMSANGVEISGVEKVGRKRLAYQIQKGKSGFYVIFHFTSPREYITKYERTLRLDENVIRFLTIKLEKKDLDFIEKKKNEVTEAEKVVTKTEETEVKVEKTATDVEEATAEEVKKDDESKESEV